MRGKYSYLTDRQISFLKIISCVAVIGLHTFVPYILVLVRVCSFAIPVFFMASGYFLLNRGEINWKYVKKKVYAIIRIIVLWNIFMYIVQLACGLYKGESSLVCLPIELIIQIIKSVIQKGKMWQFWYLGALILLYGCLPVMSKIFNVEKKYKKISIKYKGIVWFGFFIISISIQVVSMLKGTALQQSVIQTFRIWSWLQYFCLGGLVPSLTSIIEKKVRASVHLLLVCMSTFFVVRYQDIVGNIILKTIYPEYFYDSIFIMIWVFTIFTFGLRIKFSKFQIQCISELNTLILGVYCIHPTIISIITQYIVIENVGSSIIVFISVFFISFTLIWVLGKNKIIKKYFLCI